MKISILIVMCIGCTLLLALGIKKNQDPVIPMSAQMVREAKMDTILPDTTLEKIDRLKAKRDEYQALLDAAENKLQNERAETKLMKSNSYTLETITNKVEPIPTPVITSTAPAYPDSIKIIVEVKRRPFFKRNRP